ncbi:hypothetical protein [uncultured Polaribacter sp.]|uniref:hypothetical protein n=1 Tax=uncultured Polaribacter sp. TaxID=174711 RepID=UPI0026315771|nr:hypothetical protein [uncultured Polaribacter sp.]
MKKLLYNFIIFSILFNCNSKDDCRVEDDICITENLGIEKTNIVSNNDDENLIFPYYWEWRELSDNLIETVYLHNKEDGLDEDINFHLFFLKTSNCIELIRFYKKETYFDVDINTGAVFISNIKETEYEINFLLQEYIGNNLIIGKNNTTKFKIELSENNIIK